MGKGGQKSLDPAINGANRRSARAIGADAVSVGQLGANHREGRGRTKLTAAQDRWRTAKPRQGARDAAGGAHHLSWLRTYGGGRASWARGPARETWLRHARRVTGGVRRCIAAAGGGGNVPLSGRAPLLVRHSNHRHETGPGPRPAAQARSRPRGAGGGTAAGGGSSQD